MARNVTLGSLLIDLRQEARISGNPAHNASSRDAHVRLLQRTQERLWRMHDWEYLRVRRYLPLQAGQRFYDPAAAYKGLSVASEAPSDLSLDRLEDVSLRYGDAWVHVHPGIDDGHYTVFDSERDERSWPVERWRVWEDSVEVWPVPADNADAASLEGWLRLTGIRNLRPLVAEDDRCDLEGDLIVSYAASELLGAAGAADAAAKREAADRLYSDLIGNAGKIKVFSMIGGRGAAREPKGPPRVHYRDREPS